MTKNLQQHPLLPPGRILRKMGYLKDQQGIIRRYLREAENWDPHLDRCSNFILDTLKRPDLRSPGFLGSGWLLDIPLEELIKTCDRILLFDIVHPPQVVHRAKKMPSVTLVEADITGGWISYAYHLVHPRRKSAGKIENEKPVNGFDLSAWPVDHWFSVNILDQLDALVVDYLKKFRVHDETVLKAMAAEIQSQHLGNLKNAGGSIITGTSEIMIRGGEPHNTSPVVHVKLPPGTNRRSWTWVFDTAGEYHQGSDTHFEVVALNL